MNQQLIFTHMHLFQAMLNDNARVEKIHTVPGHLGLTAGRRHQGEIQAEVFQRSRDVRLTDELALAAVPHPQPANRGYWSRTS